MEKELVGGGLCATALCLEVVLQQFVPCITALHGLTPWMMASTCLAPQVTSYWPEFSRGNWMWKWGWAILLTQRFSKPWILILSQLFSPSFSWVSNYVKQASSWEIDSCSASYSFPPITCSQVLVISPYPELGHFPLLRSFQKLVQVRGYCLIGRELCYSYLKIYFVYAGYDAAVTATVTLWSI